MNWKTAEPSMSGRGTRSGSESGFSEARRSPGSEFTAARRPADKPEFTVDRRSDLLEFAWVTVVIGVILLNLQLGPFAPMVLLMMVPAFGVLRWERIYPLLADCWPLLLLPAFALASSLWSEVPGTTIWYGTLYLATALIGIIIGAGCRPDLMLKGLFTGFLGFSLLSLASWRWVDWGEGAGLAFAGLSGSKNSAGDIAGLSLLAAFVVLAWAVPRRQVAFGLLALALLPVAAFTLWASRATGAQIATVIAAGCIGLWLLSRNLPIQARMTVFIATFVTVITAVVLQDLWLPPLFEFVLESTGKDAGLTGRRDLWDKADELVAARPWLGLGYNAFWLHNNLDAEYLWRLMGIENRSGFNFHSTFREIAVHLGYVGLGLFALVGGVGAVRILAKTMVDAAIPAIFLSGVMVFLIPKLPFEVIGLGTMHFSTIMFFAVLAAGYHSYVRRSAARVSG